MLKYSILFSFGFLVIQSYGQTCDCSENFKYLKAGVENNYSGFLDKTNGLAKRRYEFFADSIGALIKDEKNIYNCYIQLRSFTSFFNDQHLTLTLNINDSTKPFFKTLFSAFERENIDTNTYVNNLKKKSANTILGIWVSEDRNTEIIVEPKFERGKGKYVAFIWKSSSIFWNKGQKLFETSEIQKSKMTFFNYDRRPIQSSYSIKRNILEIDIDGKWLRKTKDIDFPNEKTNPDFDINTIISLKKTEDNYCVLKISNFHISYKKKIDSVLAANEKILSSTKYLIIDLRNNGGGHSQTFENLLPLLYTNAIYKDGDSMRSSPDNIRLFKEILSNPNYSSEKEKVKIETIIKKLESSEGQFVEINKREPLPLIMKSKPYPEKIAILSNSVTVSAAEQFLIYAKQSKKTTLFGQSSAGSIDYVNYVSGRSMPCNYFLYYAAISKSERVKENPLDNIGVKPDIVISENMDWIKYVKSYFRKALNSDLK
jgi:Peptidase family S41